MPGTRTLMFTIVQTVRETLKTIGRPLSGKLLTHPRVDHNVAAELTHSLCVTEIEGLCLHKN